MAKPIPRTPWTSDGAQNDMIGRHVEFPRREADGACMGRITAVRRIDDGAHWEAKIALDYHPETLKFRVAELQPIHVSEDGHVTFAHRLSGA